MLGLMTPRILASVDFNDPNYWTGGGISYRAMTRAGVTVDEEIALTYHAVFCATRVLAEGLGAVPLPCYERTSHTDRNPAMIDVAELMNLMVNPQMSATVFREGRTAHQANWGSGFAEISRSPKTGRIDALWPIHPSRVFVSTDPNYAYMVRANSGAPMPLHADEMLHLPGAISDDGIWGRGLINYGREEIGGGLGTDRAAHSFLGSGGQPKGTIEIPGMQDRQKRAAFREEWREVHGKPESNEPTIAIIAPGTKYTPISLTNEANQMIQSRAVNKTNIATLYKIPAYKINAEDKETAGTIEQKAIEFVIHSLLPWARKWEDQLALKLLNQLERLRYYFEHNFTALLRGDPKARYDAYRIAFSIGVLTINEIRRLENLNNIGPAGDQHFVPANMTTAERAQQGDFGNGGATGSDHSGSPADNPMDRQASASADPDKQFHAWMQRLTGIQRADVRQQFDALRHDLPERPADYVGVARSALHDVLGRMLTKESNAAARAAKSNDFDAWLRTFYGEHQTLMADALRTACMTLRVAGLTRWADRLDLAEWLRARSVETLTASYNSDTPEVFSRKLAAWPTSRAAELTEEILEATA